MHTAPPKSAPVKLQLSLGPEHIRLLQEFVSTYSGPVAPCSELALSVLKHFCSIAAPSVLADNTRLFSADVLDAEIASLSQ